MFAYPLSSIPTHFQPILIENQSNPIGIDPKSEFSLRFYPTKDINAQYPHAFAENSTHMPGAGAASGPAPAAEPPLLSLQLSRLMLWDFLGFPRI